ncbi:hypothetical protein NMG60_11025000 [Bertholletia excelsa]
MARSSRSSAEENYVLVEIKQEQLVLTIKEKMESTSTSQSICRVREMLPQERSSQYSPKVVSIGPLCHDEQCGLEDAEKHKWLYLNSLLTRKPNLEESLEKCVEALRELEVKVRNCYGGQIHLTADELVKMMLVDGCFIIELLFKSNVKSLRRRDDYFFGSKERFAQLRRDLILLDNQIPFFVLERLFGLVQVPKQCTTSLPDMVLTFFKRMVPPEVQTFQGRLGQEFKHILDLIHHCFLPSIQEPECQEETSTNKEDTTKSATTLKRDGIQFTKVTAESLLDIKFSSSRGVLQIPPLKFHDFTEFVLTNLIALELCCSDRPKHVASYVSLMGMLIQNDQDVRLLYRASILTNGLEKREEVKSLFKNVQVKLENIDFFYRGLWKQVCGYKRPNWVKSWLRMNRLERDRMGVVGFSLAILFLVLVFIGTLFSVLSFTLHHRKS